MRTLKISLTLIPCILLVWTTVTLATTKAPTKPLAERVSDAETVFLGKVINKKIEGDWATAELLVEEPLKNAEKGAKCEVVWRISLGKLMIYDTAEGTTGIAILGDKHKGRYWLRDDKFENPKTLEKVKKLIKDEQEK